MIRARGITAFRRRVLSSVGGGLRRSSPVARAQGRELEFSSSASPSGSGGSITVPDFDDVESSFSSKTTGELLRSYMVLKVCEIRAIVGNARILLSVSRKVLGSSITNFVVRQSFFKVFCAGETEDATVALMGELEKSGVGGILDYAAEADVSADTERADVALAESRDQMSAHTYDYEGEAMCDANAEITHRSIETAGRRPGGFVAVKMTALGKPDLLEHMSSILMETRQVFHSIADNIEDGGSLSDTESSRRTHQMAFGPEHFKAAINRSGLAASMSDAEAEEIFQALDTDRSGRVNYNEWIDSMNPETLAMGTHLSSFQTTQA